MNNRVRILLGVFAVASSFNLFAASADGAYPAKAGQYLKLYEDGDKKKIVIAVVKVANSMPTKTVAKYKDLSGESVTFDKSGTMQVLDYTKYVNRLSQKALTVKA